MSDLNAPVLVLNSGWTPIHIKPVKDAISDVFNEAAEIIEHSDEEIVSRTGDVLSACYMSHDWKSWHDLSPFAIKQLSDSASERQELGNLSKRYLEPRVISTTRGPIRGPEVIRLIDYNEIPDMEIRLTRRNLLLRDNFTCQYCGKRVSSSTFTIDHVIPRSHGGEGSWENFVVSCFKCNTAKRDRTPKEANMPLRQEPKKPRWYPLSTRFAFRTPQSWVKFLPKSAFENRPQLDAFSDTLSKSK